MSAELLLAWIVAMAAVQVLALLVIGAVRVRRGLQEARDTALRLSPRPLRVVARLHESPDGAVCSFHLVAADGRPLPDFKPGQFITVRAGGTDG